ncbi:MAG: RNA polymerase sigma factor [Rhodoluna sp.]|jgi:RNA polymerase sigma factor (sigma-70 family)
MTNELGINDDSLRLLADNYVWLRYTCRRENFKQEEELFSLVVEKALGSLSGFKDQGYGIKPWLRVIVKNTNKDLLRTTNVENSRRAPNVVTFDGDGGEQVDIFDNPIDEALHAISAEDRFIYLQELGNMAKALRQLEEPFQQTIRLWLTGYSYNEIAAEMGVSTNTVGTRIHRAKQDLRKLLKDLAIEYGFSSKDKKK